MAPGQGCNHAPLNGIEGSLASRSWDKRGNCKLVGFNLLLQLGEVNAITVEPLPQLIKCQSIVRVARS